MKRYQRLRPAVPRPGLHKVAPDSVTSMTVTFLRIGYPLECSAANAAGKAGSGPRQSLQPGTTRYILSNISLDEVRRVRFDAQCDVAAVV